MEQYSLVFLRHGESLWNAENLFSGWEDIDLSDVGKGEARQAGALLKENGWQFDIAYTSYLKRAIRTLWIVLDEMDCMWLPTRKSWRLNERHYGALQGLNKRSMAEKHGEEQVHMWRRDYHTRPPPMSDSSFLLGDRRYSDLSCPPNGESLEMTVDRVLPLWNDSILPQLNSGRKVLIVAHGNSIRAMIQHIEKLPIEQLRNLNIPTGVPLVYSLNHKFEVLTSFYLGTTNAKKQML